MTRERVLKLPVLEILGRPFKVKVELLGKDHVCKNCRMWLSLWLVWFCLHLGRFRKPTRMTADEVIEALDALGTYDYVTLSGGNPALLAANMAQLVSKLKARGVTLAVETQGSRWQEWLKDIDQVTLSPKPPSSKMEVNMEPLTLLFPSWILIKLPSRFLFSMMQI